LINIEHPPSKFILHILIAFARQSTRFSDYYAIVTAIAPALPDSGTVFVVQ